MTIANDVTPTTVANNRRVASVASGFAIANINQATAAQYCSDIGASLITNREWMTIARNIEAQSSNWTGGAVGSGGLWRGHSDSNPGGAQVAGLDTDPYTGTGNVAPSIERRTHTLSNGEVIWDLSGNVWELTVDTILGPDKPTPSGTQQWTAITNFGSLSYDLTRPGDTSWNSSQNAGQYLSGSLAGGPYALLRGGDWGSVGNVGLYALRLVDIPSNISDSIGFRCVLN